MHYLRLLPRRIDASNGFLPGLQADFYREAVKGGRCGCSGTNEMKPAFNVNTSEVLLVSIGAT